MSILILESSGYSKNALERYSELGDVWLSLPGDVSSSEVKVLVVRLAVTLTKDYLSRFPSLRAIVSPTTGLDHIDLEACRRRGIRVFSLADCRRAIEQITSTSELALGLMISLARYIVPAHRDVVEHGNWQRDKYRSRMLSRQSLGIVGFGRIGARVARYAEALGMRVLAYDSDEQNDRFADGTAERCSFPELLAEADIISIHASLGEDNVRMINRDAIDQMRTGVLLVNTARGALIDELEVVSGLESGKIGGVAVDVLTNEHAGDSLCESPLVLAAKNGYNVIITPHVGGCTRDAMEITEERLAEFAVRSLHGVI